MSETPDHRTTNPSKLREGSSPQPRWTRQAVVMTPTACVTRSNRSDVVAHEEAIRARREHECNTGDQLMSRQETRPPVPAQALAAAQRS